MCEIQNANTEASQSGARTQSGSI